MQVTDFVVHENMTIMAVGFEQGTINVYKGDVAKDRYVNIPVEFSLLTVTF